MGHAHASTRGKNYMSWTRKDMERVADSIAHYLTSMARCSDLDSLVDGGRREPVDDSMFGCAPHIPEDSRFLERMRSIR